MDLDGTLTDARTCWQGSDIGWVQYYSVRDGEAILRMTARGLPVVPVSANTTRSACERMQLLGLPTKWLGTEDKPSAVIDISRTYDIPLNRICYVGDGLGDCAVFTMVGLACAVSDAHPEALRQAHFVTKARGGARVLEEIEQLIFHANP